MKKKITNSLSILMIGCIILLVAMISHKTNVKMDNFMIIGEKIGDNSYVELLLNKIDPEQNYSYDITFTSNTYTTSQILKIIEQDGKKSINNKMVTISDVIEKSKYICINIGKNDLDSKISTTNNTLIYDKDILERQTQISINYIYNIIENIKNYNSLSDIILLSTFINFPHSQINKYEDLEKIYYNFNSKLYELATLCNIKYIDISHLGSETYMVNGSINEKGNDYLANKLETCIIDNIC